MADMFDTGNKWLAGQMQGSFSRSISYSRALNSVSISASVGKSSFDIDDGAGLVTRFQTRDYFLLSSALILASALTTPRRGDRITEVIGAETFIYEIIGEKGIPEWEYTDSSNQMLRVRTKQVKT